MEHRAAAPRRLPPTPPPLRTEADQRYPASLCLITLHCLLTCLCLLSLQQESYTSNCVRPDCTLNCVCPKYTIDSFRTKYTLNAVEVNYTFKAVGPLYVRLCTYWGSHPLFYYIYFQLSDLPPRIFLLHLPVTSPAIPVCAAPRFRSPCVRLHSIALPVVRICRVARAALTSSFFLLVSGVLALQSDCLTWVCRVICCRPFRRGPARCISLRLCLLSCRSPCPSGRSGVFRLQLPVCICCSHCRLLIIHCHCHHRRPPPPCRAVLLFVHPAVRVCPAAHACLVWSDLSIPFVLPDSFVTCLQPNYFPFRTIFAMIQTD